MLGRGGTGVVYEAHDTKDDTVVALKTIGADVPDLGEHVYRLKHEFRALADLQRLDHLEPDPTELARQKTYAVAGNGEA